MTLFWFHPLVLNPAMIADKLGIEFRTEPGPYIGQFFQQGKPVGYAVRSGAISGMCGKAVDYGVIMLDKRWNVLLGLYLFPAP